MPKRPPFYVFLALYTFALLQFVRYYVNSTVFYLDMHKYLHGQERLPFQERVLPILFLRPLSESPWMMHHLVHANSAVNAARAPFYLLSLISLLIASIYAQRLYTALSTRRTFSFLVFPVLLFVVTWTYVIHSEADYSYPYDFPSLAFFTAGLYYLYRRQYLPLFLVVLLGTFNRETTLFLIGLYFIDSATVVDSNGHETSRFDLRLISWPRLALLCFTWIAIKLSLKHIFAGNNTSESFLRISDNFHELKPRLLPALLNICGYTVPLVVIFRRRIASIRFRNYLWILPLWFAVMFCSGVLLETRIYGELCSYCAVALVLMMEDFLPLSASSYLKSQLRTGHSPRLAGSLTQSQSSIPGRSV